MSLMQDLSVIIAVSTFWLAAMIVPGLDFLLVTRLAVLRGRSAAWEATLGIATGVAIWGLGGFFGIRSLFYAAPWLYLLLKIGGGLYLFVAGCKLLIGSWKPNATDTTTVSTDVSSGAFRAGLLTNLVNPKAPIFVSSLFAAAMPQHAPVPLGLACVVAMSVIALAWFTLVATVLSIGRVSSAFLRCRRWVDRCAGLAFMALGVRFITERSPA